MTFVTCRVLLYFWDNVEFTLGQVATQLSVYLCCLVRTALTYFNICSTHCLDTRPKESSNVG